MMCHQQQLGWGRRMALACVVGLSSLGSLALAVVQENAAPKTPDKVLATRPEVPTPTSIEPPIVEIPKVKIDISRQSLPTGGMGGGGSHWDAFASDASVPAASPQMFPPSSVVPPPQFQRFDPAVFGQPFGFNNGWGGGGGGWPIYGDGTLIGPIFGGPLGTIGTTQFGSFGASLPGGSLGVSIVPRPANTGNNSTRLMTATYRGSGAPTPIPAYNQSIQNFKPTYNGFTIPPGHGPIKYPGGGGSRAVTPTPRPGATN